MTPEDFKQVRELCKTHISAMHSHMRLATYMKKIIEDVQKGAAALVKENAADGGVFLSIFKKDMEEAKKIEWKLTLSDAPTPAATAPATSPTPPPAQTGGIAVHIVDKNDRPYAGKVKVTLVAVPEGGKLDVQRRGEIHNPDGTGAFDALPLDRRYVIKAETEEGIEAELLSAEEEIQFTSLVETVTFRVNDELTIELLNYTAAKTSVEFATRQDLVFRVHGARRTLAWTCIVTDPAGKTKKTQGASRQAQVPIEYNKLGTYVIELTVNDGRGDQKIRREVDAQATKPYDYVLVLDVEEHYATKGDVSLEIDGVSHRFAHGECRGPFIPGPHTLHDPKGTFEDATFKLENQLYIQIPVKKKHGPFQVEVRDVTSGDPVQGMDVQLDIFITQPTGVGTRLFSTTQTDAAGVADFKDVPVDTEGAVYINRKKEAPLYNPAVMKIDTSDVRIVEHITKVSDLPSRKDLDKLIDDGDDALVSTPVNPFPFNDYKAVVYKFIRDSYTKKGVDGARLTDKFVEQILHMMGYDEHTFYMRWVELKINRYLDVEHFVRNWVKANPAGSEAQCMIAYANVSPLHRPYDRRFMRTVTRYEQGLLTKLYRDVKAAGP